jgi:hypothetical protein
MNAPLVLKFKLRLLVKVSGGPECLGPPPPHPLSLFLPSAALPFQATERVMKPAPLKLSDPTEISVTASWDKVNTATLYKIYFKSIADDDISWEQANHQEFAPDSIAGEVDGLEPTNTYIFRLAVVTPDGDSELSDEAIIDTLVAGCGGASDKKKSGCCQIS